VFDHIGDLIVMIFCLQHIGILCGLSVGETSLNVVLGLCLLYNFACISGFLDFE